MSSVTSVQRRDGSCGDEIDGTPPKETLADVTALAHRLAAQTAYDAYAATGRVGPIDCEKKRDAGRCGVETVQNPVLFDQQEDDASPIDGSDVTQTTLGDCHLMATLATLASTPRGRELIKSAVVEEKDAGGKVTSYTVTLYKPTIHVSGPTTFSEVKFNMDGHFGEALPLADGSVTVKHAEARLGQDGKHEIWSLVVEKAFAQYHGSYGAIDGHGSPARAMELLTGKPATDIRLDRPPGYSPERLECDLAAGKVVVLLTKESIEGSPSGIVANHGYQVTAADRVDGKLMVALHNPWNKKGGDPAPIPYENLHRWFAAIDVGSVR